jgi:site-specific DNA recombinase
MNLPCAIYTRKSSEEGLEQGFNSLDAQREACEAFIQSQKALGWKVLKDLYDDGGYSGGNMERPALKRLLNDIQERRVRIVVVYKVDRLTRSLADFAKLVELFDALEVSFVSVTQQFNTTTSMGRLTLNVLLSFAQFEREVTGERIRDKIAASKRKGMWMGGLPPVGYLPKDRSLVIDEPQADRIRHLFRRYLELDGVGDVKAELDRLGWGTPLRNSRRGNQGGGKPFTRGHLYRILSNPIYLGKITHKGHVYTGSHPAIVDAPLWQAVQDKLGRDRTKKALRTRTTDPSLLAGLVYDEQGDRLSPTHTRRGTRRYRYYVSQALIGKDRSNSPQGLRVPANELEQAVLQGLDGLLRDESSLARLKTGSPTEIRQRLMHASSTARQLAEVTGSARIEILMRLVKQIVVSHTVIRLMVNIEGLWHADHAPLPDDEATTLELPIQLKRRGMAVRLIVRSPHGERQKPDGKLISLIAKGRRWFGRLASGDFATIRELADHERVSAAYVTRVVYLAFLEPGIIQHILDGSHPPDLTADRLIRSVPLPELWEDQRRLLGFVSN